MQNGKNNKKFFLRGRKAMKPTNIQTARRRQRKASKDVINALIDFFEEQNSDYTFELNVDFYPLSAYKNNNFITESLKSGKSKSFYWLIAFVLFLSLIFCLLFYV